MDLFNMLGLNMLTSTFVEPLASATPRIGSKARVRAQRTAAAIAAHRDQGAANLKPHQNCGRCRGTQRLRVAVQPTKQIPLPPDLWKDPNRPEYVTKRMPIVRPYEFREVACPTRHPSSR